MSLASGDRREGDEILAPLGAGGLVSPAEARQMKAAVSTRYGPPDVVHITDVEKPDPKDNEVLIQVRAASVNPLDLFSMRGAPLIRLIPGLRVQGLGDGWLVRPNVAVGWFF